MVPPLIWVAPARTSGANLKALPMSRVHNAAMREYSLAFANSTASSSRSNVVTDTTKFAQVKPALSLELAYLDRRFRYRTLTCQAVRL